MNNESYIAVGLGCIGHTVKNALITKNLHVIWKEKILSLVLLWVFCFFCFLIFLIFSCFVGFFFSWGGWVWWLGMVS